MSCGGIVIESKCVETAGVGPPGASRFLGSAATTGQLQMCRLMVAQGKSTALHPIVLCRILEGRDGSESYLGDSKCLD